MCVVGDRDKCLHKQHSRIQDYEQFVFHSTENQVRVFTRIVRACIAQFNIHFI